MTNQHKRDRFHKDTWIDRDRCTYPTNQHKCPMVVHCFFFEFYIFLLVFWDHFRTFERFWEILRDFERFGEILRNFHFTQQYYFFNYNGSHASDFERFWEIVRNFEKFWENSSQVFLVLFSRFDLLPHGIAGICCDNGWSHMQSVSYLLVVLQLLPRLDSWLHHEEKTPVTVPLCFTYNVCCESSSILYQD